ncbi:MAG: signal peptidase II [Acidobacteria bacterium]|nr:MAG: signal peptidase II [Acidobacteriota bacterium]REK10404.1 MAG: signal peptidase II [Acidobacteriota bacterium]
MPDAETSTRSPIKSWLLAVAALVFALDQWTKLAIERGWALYQTVEVVPGFFNLIHVKNTGIAFGLFPSRGELVGTLVLGLFGALALILVSIYFARTPPDRRLLLVALALVLGGAVGNLVDRIAFQAVTDFLDVYVGTRHWPTFNVADSAITGGIVCLVVESLFAPAPEPAAEDERESVRA